MIQYEFAYYRYGFACHVLKFGGKELQVGWHGLRFVSGRLKCCVLFDPTRWGRFDVVRWMDWTWVHVGPVWVMLDKAKS